MKKVSLALFYFLALSLPFVLGILAVQSSRYALLEQEIRGNAVIEEEVIADNRRLILEIAELSAPARIEGIARGLGMTRKQPEEVLKIHIAGSGL